jgi:hypothetical protein
VTKPAKHALLREADNQRYSKPVRIFAGDPDQPIEVGFARFDHLLGAWVEPETLEPLDDDEGAATGTVQNATRDNAYW